MSTRSRIGLLLEDGSIRSVYHHWDGYPEALGAKLVRDYITKDQVSELIDGGDISTCMSKSNWDNESTATEFVLYYKDRGDLDCGPEVSDNDVDYFRLTRNCDGEFAYLFDPKINVWGCFDMHSAVTIPIHTEPQ